MFGKTSKLTTNMLTLKKRLFNMTLFGQSGKNRKMFFTYLLLYWVTGTLGVLFSVLNDPPPIEKLTNYVEAPPSILSLLGSVAKEEMTVIILIYMSSLLATQWTFNRMKNRLKNKITPYLILGFLIANISLFWLFSVFPSLDLQQSLPLYYFFLVVIGVFSGFPSINLIPVILTTGGFYLPLSLFVLFICYFSPIVLLALIPSLLSALILYIVQPYL